MSIPELIEKWRDSLNRMATNRPIRELDRTPAYLMLRESTHELSKAWQAEQARGWLPIESAPKDGSIVRVTDGNAVLPCQWEDVDYNEWTNRTAYDWVPIPPFETNDTWKPTHWQPLTPAPKGSSDAK